MTITRFAFFAFDRLLNASGVFCFGLFKYLSVMTSVTMAEAIEMRSKLEKAEADSDQLSDILNQLLERVRSIIGLAADSAP